MKDTNLNELLYGLYEEEIEELKRISEDKMEMIINKMKDIEEIYQNKLRDNLVITVSNNMQDELKQMVDKFNELESRIIKNKVDHSLLWKCEYAKANLISLMMDIDSIYN